MPLKVSGLEIAAAVTAPVPLPVRIPPSVVEPVPPNATPSALVRLSVWIVVEPVTASAVVVAPVAVRPPLNAIWVVVALDGKR